jgi:hypothetical protein
MSNELNEKEIIDSIQFVVFSDAVGRNVIGELVEDTGSQIVVKCPAIVLEQINPQTQQRSLGYVEAFYPQLLVQGTSSVWYYNKDRITIIDATLNDEAKKLYAIVIGKISPQQQVPQSPVSQGDGNEGTVVNMFDEE